MAKRRYSASKIARTPSLKRDIAELLAKFEAAKTNVTLHQALAYGHRGFISYNEDDLCKMFDKLYSEHLESINAKIKEIEETKINPRHGWEVSRKEHQIAQLKGELKQFEKIAEELFEAKVLR